MSLIDFVGQQGPEWVAQMVKHAGVQTSIKCPYIYFVARTRKVSHDMLVANAIQSHQLLHHWLAAYSGWRPPQKSCPQ